MIKINSSISVPDHKLARELIQQSMEKGIRISNSVFGIESTMSNLQQEVATKIYNISGIVNPNSTKQVKDYYVSNLDNDLLDVCFSEDTQKYSFNKESLEYLAEAGDKCAVLLMEYRGYKNKKEKALELINNMDENNMVRPKLAISNTNRINYIEPNIIGIPKEMFKDLVRPRKEGNKVFSIDIKNQEPLIVINWFGIDKVREIMETLKIDEVYKALFIAVYGEHCDSDIKLFEFKVSWIALTYGLSMKSIVKKCKHIDGKILWKFFTSIPEYKEYKENCSKKARQGIQDGYTFFGTPVFADAAGFALARSLMNIPIQGTGADLIVFLINAFDDYLSKNSMHDYMEFYYSRHDELLVEVDGKSEGNIEAWLTSFFTHQVDDWIPFKVVVKQVC